MKNLHLTSWFANQCKSSRRLRKKGTTPLLAVAALAATLSTTSLFAQQTQQPVFHNVVVDGVRFVPATAQAPVTVIAPAVVANGTYYAPAANAASPSKVVFDISDEYKWRIQAGLSIMSTKTQFTYEDGDAPDSYKENYFGIAIGAERKIFECFGGLLLIGGEIDYLSGKTDLPSDFEETLDRTAIPVQVTASWEYNKLLNGKLGIRAGISLGFIRRSITSKWTDEDDEGNSFEDTFKANATSFIWGLHTGVNYNITKSFYVDLSQRLLFIPSATWSSGIDEYGYDWHTSQKGKTAYQVNISAGWRF